MEYEEKGISTVFVMGGSGDYFSLADVVIGMIEYGTHDLTAQAHQIAKKGSMSQDFHVTPPSEIPRIPIPNILNASKGKRHVHIRPEGFFTALW